jgi:ureidoacrylate peracid hydrolase
MDESLRARRFPEEELKHKKVGLFVAKVHVSNRKGAPLRRHTSNQERIEYDDLLRKLLEVLLAYRGVIENNKRVTEAARKAGCKIVYLKMSYDPDYSNSGGPESPNWHKELGLVMMRKNPEYWGRFVTRGSWDEEICEELKPEPGDIVVRKQRYSGFAGTNLDLILKTYHIQYCIYTGVATNVCVESTLRDGYFLDYWPIVVSDAVNHVGPKITQDATFWNIETLFGWVTTTDDLLRALSGK